VLAAALRLIDAEGVEARPCAGSGSELDRDPMRLYRYAPSKDALLDAVVELVMAELEIAPVDNANWQDVLRRTAHAYRDLALAHPHVVPLLVTRPLATPLAMRPPGTLRPWRTCSNCSSVWASKAAAPCTLIASSSAS
jgi:AcrR family transcriptional regulator